MPRPDQADQQPPLSRRSLLRSAAGAGAAGLAITALGAATTQPEATQPTATRPDATRPDATRPTTTEAATAARATQAQQTTRATPIVVHVRDARTGDIEVFAGTSQTRLRDHALAARIARAIT